MIDSKIKDKFEMADALRSLRKKLKLSQLDLAKKLKASESAVAQWENAINMPSKKYLKKIMHLVKKQRETNERQKIR